MFQVSVSMMPSSTYIFLRIFLVIVGTRLKSTECSGIIYLNSVTLNSDVSFECQGTGVVAYLWRVNGTLLTDSTPGLTVNTYPNLTKSELFVLASMDRDGLLIECGVILGDFSEVYSEPPAVLRIQGLLDPVTNLVVHSTSTSITLSWVPPFSLDITGVDPDFTHTVEVYNITSGERSLVDTIPDITDSTFTFSLNDTGHEGLATSFRDELADDVFQFIVFAVNDVGEGEKRDINVSFFDPTVTTEMRTTMETTMQSTKAMTTTTAEHTTASVEDDSGQTTASDSVSLSELTTIIFSSTVVAFVVGALLGSVITLIMVMIVNCLRKHAQHSTALETESGEIEMKSCDAYNVVAKKQKPPPPMYEEVDL